ncbi:MAG: MBL fold metallo-hydrolase [Rhodospirillaceae bacterium]
MTGRRLFICAFLLAVSAVPCAGTVLAGAGHGHAHSRTEIAQTREAKIATQAVAGSVSILIGQGGFTGGNVAVLPGPDGLLIVDDKLSDFSEKLGKALDAFGKGRPKFVLNTHWHFDHTGGNQKLGDAIIVAHDHVRATMSKPAEMKSLGRVIPASPPEALPDVTYSKSLTLHFNGEEIQVTHLPSGHTGGDSIVYFKTTNVLHLGDLFFNGMFPFCDTEYGGNAFGMVHNIGEILKTFPADAKVIPGHGPLATMKDLKAYHDMLIATTAHVQAGIKAGQDLKALQAAGFPAQWKTWEWAFIDSKMWIGLIHASLNK